MSWPARVPPNRSLQEKANGFLPKPTEGWLGVWDIPCTQLGEIEDLQSADIYPVVKVLPLAGSRRNLVDPVPSDPLVGGALPTDQRSDVGIDTRTTARFRRAAVSTALALELDGASRPAIHLLSGACQASGSSSRFARSGGDEETRTPDPLLAKEMLCQLSYVPRRQGNGGRYWTRTSDLCLIRAAL